MRLRLQTPFFLILLPAFFFLHALSENYNVILVKDALVLFFIYTSFAILLTFISWLFYKNIQKASLAVFTLMSANFFFGSFHDFFRKILQDSFILRFSFILPAILILISVSLYLIKRSQKKYLKITIYLNILFTAFILLDAVLLLTKISGNKNKYIANLVSGLSKCDTCERPDIYLIVADEYAGKQELQDIFLFDNSPFETELKNRGFHITGSSISNYNSTLYSMTSLLNMDYIKKMTKSGEENFIDILFCRELIQKNNFIHFLEQEGYRILNYSFVDIGSHKKAVQNILSTNKTILTASTLLYRMRFAFGAKLASQKKLDELKTRELADNIKVATLLKQSFSEKSDQPRFVYTHFNMPHWPYFFDSAGNKTALDKLTEEFKYDKKAYIEYLKYTNNKLLEYIDLIKENSDKPPIIILMSDHGFRQLPPGTDKKYYFMNLNTIYLPSGKYSGFYDGISNVNQFRVILNTVFNQQLHMLPDTTNFVRDY